MGAITIPAAILQIVPQHPNRFIKIFLPKKRSYFLLSFDLRFFAEEF